MADVFVGSNPTSGIFFEILIQFYFRLFHHQQQWKFRRYFVLMSLLLSLIRNTRSKFQIWLLLQWGINRDLTDLRWKWNTVEEQWVVHVLYLIHLIVHVVLNQIYPQVPPDFIVEGSLVDIMDEINLRDWDIKEADSLLNIFLEIRRLYKVWFDFLFLICRKGNFNFWT